MSEQDAGAPGVPGDTPGKALRTVFILIAAGLGVVLFGFLGNSHAPERYGPSVVSWLVNQWRDPGSKSGHGFLIPLVSLGLLWRRRRDLVAADRHVAPWGLAVVAVALVSYWLGYRTQQTRLGVLGLMGVLWGVPLYLWGGAVARALLFPCAYLVFAIPMGFLTAFTFPLRLISCKVSTALLNGIGIGARQKGTLILSDQPGLFALNVEDPCSGLQSLIAMSALTAAYAYLTQERQWKRWVLFLCALPLAMAGNVVRLVTLGVVAAAFGQEAAMKVYHDYSGFIVFTAAVLLMAAVGAWLKTDFRERVKQWAPQKQSRT
jgi:exosortase